MQTEKKPVTSQAGCAVLKPCTIREVDAPIGLAERGVEGRALLATRVRQ